jgi:hypothetical protein
MATGSEDKYFQPSQGLLNDWTNGVDRDYVLKSVHNQQRFNDFAKLNLTADIAERASAIYLKAPWIAPDTILSLAKGGASPEAVDTIAELQAFQKAMEKKNEKSWFERNIYDKVKTTARWAQAAVQFVPEMTQYAGSQIYEGLSGQDDDSIDGWFASTSLGTMIGNSTKSGNGWFIGGEAKTIQEERARRARGTIAGTNSAFTIGRGLGSVFFKPGSKPYNFLSGAIDAGVTIYTDPLNLVFGPNAVSKAFRQGVSEVPKITSETATLAAKIAAGMSTSAEEAAFQATRVNKWMEQSTYAQRLVTFLKDTPSPSEVMRAFKDKISPEMAQALAGMTDEKQIRAALAAMSSPFGLMDNATDEAIKIFNMDPNHMVRSLSEVPGSRQAFNASWREFVPGMTTWNKWVKTLVPKPFLVVDGSSTQRAEAINNIRRYVDTIGDDIDDDIWRDLLSTENLKAAQLNGQQILDIQQAARSGQPGALKQAFLDFAVHAYSISSGTDAAVKATDTLFNMMTRGVLKTNGVKDGVIDVIFKEAADNADEMRRYFVKRGLSGDDPGILRMLMESGIIDPDDVNKVLKPGMTIDDLEILSPLALSDFLKTVRILPDPRQLRSLSSNPFWRRSIQKIYVGADGTLRGPVDFITKVQNDYWKPIQLMSVGYIMRNIIDGQMRMALTGQAAGLFNSPFQYIGWAMGSARGRFNIKGQAFDYKKLAELADEDLEGAMRFYMNTQASAAGRHMWAPEESLDDVVRTGKVKVVDRTYDRPLHTQAIADQMGRGRQDLVLRLIIEGKQTNEIIDILENTSEGAAALRNLIENNKRGFWVASPNGKRTFQSFVSGWEDDVARRRDYLAALIDGNFRQRVGYLMDDGNESLRFAFLNNRAPRGGVSQLEIDDVTNHVATDVSGIKYEVVEGPGSYGRPDDMGVGSVITYPGANGDQLFQVVNSNVVNGKLVVDVQEVSPQQLFDESLNLRAGEEFKALINDAGDNGRLPQQEVFFERRPADANELNFFKKMSEKWFTQIVGKQFMRRFEKDPFWRQFYYKHVAENIDLLSPEEARKLVNDIERLAAEEGITPAQYVGGGGISRINFSIGSKEFSFGSERWKQIQAAVFGEEGGFLKRGTTGAADAVDQNVVNLTDQVATANQRLDDLRDELQDVNQQLNQLASAQPTAPGQLPTLPNNQAAQDLLQRQQDLLQEQTLATSNYRSLQEQLNAAKATSTVGTGTIDELDEYAGYMATMDVKNKFFDAAEKSNFADAMRVIAPFGSAWANIMGDYIGLMVQNPMRALRAQRSYNAAAEADPMNTGQGFIFKDYITGQAHFMFPFSSEFAKLPFFGGTENPLIAPVRQLSVGYSLVPGMGPMIQIGAGSLYKYLGSPNWANELVETFLPYGTDKGISDAFVPGWLKKAAQALAGDRTKTDTMFANTWMETVRSLASTGEYDLSDAEEQRKLLDDARDKARGLMFMRAVSQFLGPTSGTIAFKAETKNSDVYAAYLSKEFYRMQNENYDTAVEEFITTFGDDAFLYIAGKSKATVGGLEPTREFVNWEKSNSGFVERNPLVYAYFAPGGDDFSFVAWNRMLDLGGFQKLSPAELIESAQYKIGSAKYRAASKIIGPYPTDEQREWLRDYRVRLNEEYPGFPKVSIFPVGEFDRFVDKLRIAVTDKDVVNTDIAKAIKEYLDYRDAALQSLKDAGYAGTSNTLKEAKGAAVTRSWLLGKGMEIAGKVPEFGRIFDRELAAEVED